MNRLLALYESHQGKVSDKWSSYLVAYNDIFATYSDRPIRILEIGIQNGGSLEIWSKFFPNAEIIVGCDINPLCSKLTYEHPKIKVIVGDANEDETFNRVVAASQKFDIIIDDGSHRSEDIIRSFALYFPLLSEGGVFIAEDLHCSYWDSFQGGVEAPYSSINFFKRLADCVNREHWGAVIATESILSFFSNCYAIKFDPDGLDRIKEVRFRNSLAAVFKGSAVENTLGERVVVGEIAEVDNAVVRIGGTTNNAPDQTSNVFGPLGPRSEEAVSIRGHLQTSIIGHESAKADAQRQQLERTEIALIRARTNPLEPLGQLVGFHLLKVIKTVYSPFSKKGEAWFAYKSAKLDPMRHYRLNSTKTKKSEK